MKKKIETLAELLKKTDTKAEFNIIEDLESLERAHSNLRSKQFKQKLKALIQKYKESELTEIRSALLSKCLQGDTGAIRLYAEYFKPATEQIEDDGLVDVLNKKAREVFHE